MGTDTEQNAVVGVVPANKKSVHFYDQVLPYTVGLFPSDIKVKREKLLGNIHRSILGLTKNGELRPVEDLALFMAMAQQYHLNPFKKEIYATYIWDKSRQKEELVPIVSIHGLRALCRRSTNPTYTHTGGCQFEFDDDKNLVSATVEVFGRFGNSAPQSISSYTAFFDEFAKRTKDGDLNAMWSRMPRVMLAKCAEANALRMGFNLGALYIEEEVGYNGTNNINEDMGDDRE